MTSTSAQRSAGIPTIYVRAESAALRARAEQIAQTIGCEIASAPRAYGHGLLVSDAGLALEMPGFRKPLSINAMSGDIRRRAQAQRGLHLIRACGAPLAALRIIDATAGLGRDAFTLAWAGARVDMIERDLVLACLLRGALDDLSLATNAAAALIQSRLALHVGDACVLLARVYADHDVIYLDPMFGDNARGLPQREMQMLAALDQRDDGNALLAAALALRPRRVVVKRGVRQAPLCDRSCDGGAQPHHATVGKRIRFDVYQVSAL